MSARVDRLFGDSERPLRSAGIHRLLWVGIPLDVLGVLTCTSVPGMALTLIALQIIERERERVRTGELPLEHTPELLRLRKIALAGLGFCAAGFVVQLWLLSSGVYERVLERWSAAG